MMKLLKLSLRIISLPMIALLLLLQLGLSIIVGLTSIVTNLLATVFLIGAVAGCAVGASANLICQAAGIGVFFALAPHMASWLLDKVTNLVLVMWDFLQA